MNMELKKAERVYLPSTGSFGNIQKKGGILGIKESYAIIDDSGKRTIYAGKTTGDFVYTESKCTSRGDRMEIPMDGVTMIKKDFKGTQCSKFLAKYSSMSAEEKESLCKKWCEMSQEQKTCMVENRESVTPLPKATRVSSRKPKSKK